MTRRAVLSGAGAVAAGAVAAGGLAAGVASAAMAPAAGAADVGAVALGPPGTTALELVCRITQEGVKFSGSGYVTSAAGLSAGSLFSDPAQRDAAHANLLVQARGRLVGRSVESPVHVLDIEGTLEVWPAGSSKPVATYDLLLQDVLTVIAPNTGLPVLNGQARQVDAGAVAGQRFGRPAQTLRFEATGFGTRSDEGGSDVTNAQAALTIAGSMIVV